MDDWEPFGFLNKLSNRFVLKILTPAGGRPLQTFCCDKGVFEEVKSNMVKWEDVIACKRSNPASIIVVKYLFILTKQ